MTEEVIISVSNNGNKITNEKSQQENITSTATTTLLTTTNNTINCISSNSGTLPSVKTNGLSNNGQASSVKVKVRRAFSMPRNPFRSKKYKMNQIQNNDSNDNSNLQSNDINNTINECNTEQQTQQIDQQNQNTNENKNNFANRIFRRSSFRKFLSRIAHHVTNSVNISSNKYPTSSSATTNVNPNVITSTDRVPPINWSSDQTPGVTGLKNHGNTCFMNSVLQCLSHTDILAEYFVLDQYKADLKRRNKINSKKFGTKGELTEQLANVLKALWTCKNESDHSTSFKAVVDRYGSQFRSSTQHDAQEFLFWLLDKVHEDLNTASKKRYKTVKNNYGRSDEIIAAETLANHIRCNNSFVQAVFQAQFRSSLTCPRCKKQSNTFDPFHCISVQLPQLSQQTIFVTLLYLKKQPRQIKMGLNVPSGSPIVALREKLHLETGIEIDRMILVDINQTGFSRVFYDSQPISTLEGLSTIYCVEVPEIKAESNSTDLMLLVANVKKKENSLERFGTPFCIQVNRDCSYIELQKKLLKEMSGILKPEIFAYTTPLNEMFQIRLQDPSADPDTYLEPVEHPLLMEIIDMALHVSTDADAGPLHIKLLVEWPSDKLEQFILDFSDPIVEHETVERLNQQKQTEAALSLEQCLEHYTKAETLSAEDAWRCPNCQQYLPVVKTLGLWSLPDILVIHFKRFRQQHEKGPDTAKLTTMVEFPLESFDMSPHLARDFKSSRESLNDDLRSPWRRRSNNQYKNFKQMGNIDKDNRYDLYAVCYHQGDTLETGHYTAACKNPYDNQWYKFDDQRVTLVGTTNIQDEIVNNEAYILFYQRRKVDLSECSTSSTNSGDHWISKIAPLIPISKVLPSERIKKQEVEQSETFKTDKVEIENIVIPQIQSSPQKSFELPNKDESTQQIEKILIETTVIVEKTDENEEVDIEGLEFVDEQGPDSETIIKDTIVEEKLDDIEEIETPILNGHKISKESLNDEIQPIEATGITNGWPLPISKIIPVKDSKAPSIESISSLTQLRATNHYGRFSSSIGSGGSINIKDVLSTSLRSNNSGEFSLMNVAGSSHCVNLRHSFSTSSNYKLKDCDSFSTMLRNTANSCSKDTLIFIDQQSSRNLIDEDDTDDSFMGSRSLWISPVTPHKLITVSPKN